MVTKNRVDAGVVAASKIELANKIKDQIAVFNQLAVDDAEFRKLVLIYIKPEVKY